MYQEIQDASRSRVTDAPEFSPGACGKPRNSTSSRRFWSSILLAIVGVFVFGTAGAAKPPPKIRDTQPPSVSITAPAPASTVNGVISVGVSATDNVGVMRVEFRVNGSTVASLTGSPYTFSWNSGGVANGSVTLSAAAYDRAGNSSLATQTVTVANTASPTPPPPDTQPPAVSIMSPAAGSTVSGTVSVNAGAGDNVGVARVNLLVNGTQVASSTTAPYTFNWNSTTVADGGVTLSAIAYDAAGNYGSASTNATVQNGGTTASGATYYVSSSSGSDANPGTQTAPWQTLAKVSNSQSLFRPGDSILLKRGDAWREVFSIQNQAGASGAPITYGAYGSGALPQVDSQQVRTFGVYVNHVSHIVVRDIHTINATADGFYIGAGSGNVSNVVVQGVLSEYNARHGFSIEAAPGTDVDAIEYRDDTANRNGRAGFVAYNISGGGATGVHYYASKATYNGQLGASHGFSAYFANNIHYHGVEAAFTNIDPATGRANAFLGGGEGIGIAFDDYVSNSSVEHSYSHDNGGTGIMLVHNGSNTTASYNVIANNGSFGLVVNGGGNGVSNVQVINNTVYGNKNYNGIAVWGTVNGLTIKNNIVVNNVGFGIGFSWTGITNYTVANNLIFGNTYPATEPGAYLSGATGTIEADPAFVAPASGDFSLRASSPATNAGLNLGSPYQHGLAAGSIWPSAVLLRDQGPYWTIGSFVHAP